MDVRNSAEAFVDPQSSIPSEDGAHAMTHTTHYFELRGECLTSEVRIYRPDEEESPPGDDWSIARVGRMAVACRVTLPSAILAPAGRDADGAGPDGSGSAIRRALGD